MPVVARDDLDRDSADCPSPGDASPQRSYDYEGAERSYEYEGTVPGGCALGRALASAPPPTPPKPKPPPPPRAKTRVPYMKTPPPPGVAARARAADDASPAKPRLSAPAEAAGVVFAVDGRDGDYRAVVLDDGTVKNNRGEVLGFLNEETLQAGSADERFLGDLAFESAQRASMAARDADDALVATLKLDTASLVDAGGSTFAAISASGHVTGDRGQTLATIHPFDYAKQTQVALYVLFLDPGLTSPDEAGDEDAS